MKKPLFIILTVLALAALACNLATLATQKPTTQPTQAATLIEATATLSKPTRIETTATMTTTRLAPTKSSPATETLTKTTPETQTVTPAISQTPAAKNGPVVLAELNTDPMQLSVVDPLTGQVQSTFSAAGLSQIAPSYVAADAVFYLDSGYKIIRRAGFDGSSSELTFVNPTTDIFKGVILPSPDGRKIAWAVIAAETADSTHNLLKIANLDGSAELTLLDETATPPASWSPMGWSPDGKWLYFGSTPYGIGGYILFNGVTSVRRVPIAGGAAEDVLPTRTSMGDAALSPDGKTVAFINSAVSSDGSTVTLSLDLQAVGSQKIKTVTLPDGYLQAGALVWSSGSRSLVFCLAVGNPDSEAFTLVQVDTSTFSVKVLLTKDVRLLRPVTWPAIGMLWLKDGSELAWRMDMTNGKLTQVNPDLTVLSDDWR